jgi:hypothetical protein
VQGLWYDSRLSCYFKENITTGGIAHAVWDF